MPLTSAALGAIGAVGAAGVNAVSQGLTNLFNKRQYEDAWKKQQAAIQQQNQYNSPAAAVNRMRAAGINPSVAYGSGEMLGQQSEIPSAAPIPAESPLGQGSALSAIDSMLAIREQKNRNDLAMSEMAFKSAQEFLAYTQGDLTASQRDFLLETWDLEIERLHSLNEKNWQDLLESASRIRLNDQECARVATETHLAEWKIQEISQLLPARVRNMDADTALKWMQTAEGKQHIALMAAQITMMSHEDLREGIRIDFSRRDIELRERGQQLDTNWRIVQQKNWRAEQISGAIVDVGKGILGLAAARQFGEKGSLQRLPSPLYTPGNTREFGETWVR